MNITILGYGKMGHAIEKVARERGHKIVTCLREGWTNNDIPTVTDVVVEFTRPDAATENISKVLTLGYPVVSGTTGWLESSWDTICHKVNEKNGTLFYASNFSVGVYLFRELVRTLSKRLNAFPDFSDVAMEEVHHVHKLDYPSGTADSIAREDILESFNRKSKVKAYLDPNEPTDLSEEELSNTLVIQSIRRGEVAGIHKVKFSSPGVESITLEHESLGRDSLAKGVVLATEFVIGRKGIFGMADLMKEYERGL